MNLERRPRKVPLRLVLIPVLITTAAVVLGVSVYFFGRDVLGIWYYPALVVAVLIWAYGQRALFRNMMTVTRNPSANRPDGGA